MQFEDMQAEDMPVDEQNQFLNSYKKKMNEQYQETNQDATDNVEQAPSLRFEDQSEFVPSRQSDHGNRSANNRNTKTIITVLLLAAFILALIMGLSWYFGRGIEVIDLKNWQVNDAQLWAGENNINLQVEEQYNDQFDDGKIISQNPAAGSIIKKSGFVKIFVSLGHDLTVALPLPNLMAMTRVEIDAWAAANFMTKVRMTTEYDAKVAAGRVIRFEINDNTVVDEVKRNTPIYIIVSKGAEPQTVVQVTVPNFKELALPQCYQFASENGIALKVLEAFDDFAPAGTIMSQSEKAEAKVKPGTEITLNVSKGKKIIVPDFAAYSKEQASVVAAGLGMTISISERYSGSRVGGLISQNVAAGTVYEKNGFVELAYSLGNQVALSSFIGQTRDAAEVWAKGLNDQGAKITISVSTTQSNLPKGQIIYQSPINRMISYSSTVRITLSLGKAVFVPDFVAPEGSNYDLAITRDKAMALCDELKITPIFVAASKAGRLPGEVWSQSISAGSEVNEHATITLKYNPANVILLVPSFTGITQAEIIAAGFLKKLDITFVTASAPVDGYPGQIFQQSLVAGTTVAAGSKITLTISPPPG